MTDCEFPLRPCGQDNVVVLKTHGEAAGRIEVQRRRGVAAGEPAQSRRAARGDNGSADRRAHVRDAVRVGDGARHCGELGPG